MAELGFSSVHVGVTSEAVGMGVIVVSLELGIWHPPGRVEGARCGTPLCGAVRFGGLELGAPRPRIVLCDPIIRMS